MTRDPSRHSAWEDLSDEASDSSSCGQGGDDAARERITSREADPAAASDYAPEVYAIAARLPIELFCSITKYVETERDGLAVFDRYGQRGTQEPSLPLPGRGRPRALWTWRSAQAAQGSHPSST